MFLMMGCPSLRELIQENVEQIIAIEIDWKR